MDRVERMRALGVLGVAGGAVFFLLGLAILRGIATPPYLSGEWSLPMAVLLASGAGLAAGSLIFLGSLPRAEAR